MKLVTGYDLEVAEWVAQRIPYMDGASDFGPGVAIGIINNDESLIGGWVFHNYHPRFRSIELSVASANTQWLTRSILSGLFAYPFEQLKVRRVTVLTPRNNARALYCTKKLGFVREGCVRGGFGNTDAVISGMLASQWRTSRFNLLNVRPGASVSDAPEGRLVNS